MRIQLTDIQIWFMQKAIDVKEAVIPLDEEGMSEEDFKKEYGFTKKQVITSLESLSEKIKNVP